jgi:signal peptidase I
MIAPFVLKKQVYCMKKRLQFGKVKKQIDYDMIRIIGIWVFKILLVCLLAFVTDGRSETPVIPCAPPF